MRWSILHFRRWKTLRLEPWSLDLWSLKRKMRSHIHSNWWELIALKVSSRWSSLRHPPKPSKFKCLPDVNIVSKNLWDDYHRILTFSHLWKISTFKLICSVVWPHARFYFLFTPWTNQCAYSHFKSKLYILVKSFGGLCDVELTEPNGEWIWPGTTIAELQYSC